MSRKKTTLEELAAMTARGFSEIQSAMATKTDLKEVREHLEQIEERFGVLATREDLRALAASWAAEVLRLTETVKNLEARVAALEGKGRRAA